MGNDLCYFLMEIEGVLRWAQDTMFRGAMTTMSVLVASLKGESHTAESSRATPHLAHSSDGDHIPLVLAVGDCITDGHGSSNVLNRFLNHIDQGIRYRGSVSP